MKFTQRSFSAALPLQVKVSTVSKLVRFLFRAGIDAICT